MKVKALKRHGYDGVTRLQGDEYFMDNEKHVKLLAATKTIKVIGVEKSFSEKEIKRTIKSSEVRTKKTKEKFDENKNRETNKNESDSKSSEAKKGFYSRKDMIADEKKPIDKKKKAKR